MPLISLFSLIKPCVPYSQKTRRQSHFKRPLSHTPQSPHVLANLVTRVPHDRSSRLPLPTYPSPDLVPIRQNTTPAPSAAHEAEEKFYGIEIESGVDRVKRHWFISWE
ncbi:Hypothetical protein NTJ_02335 [Nesidiocoris tenuis]|uniref:Uncharacterized protein n=1 Tax=Nesidiocoris tenuis TaxID=355587 RepID=A0ABN7ABX9_9HEMI|nr:Hypothetical protein NTJ_02335 [Nesidiocoris tenuis]